MCRRKSRLGECNRGTAGFAYVGGACVVNKRLEKVNSVAIVEDTGGFSGIIVAAHELGHLLVHRLMSETHKQVQACIFATGWVQSTTDPLHPRIWVARAHESVVGKMASS